MIDTTKKVVYEAFGLKLLSEIPLPELPEISISGGSVEIIVKKGDLTTLWSEKNKSGAYFIVKENLCMFKVPGLAIYLIQDGKEITVSPTEGFNEDLSRLYILGTCMGALLIQRKIFPLHGSAIAIDGKAYAVVGESGAGKSTLASAFLKRGYRLLSDDVIPVTFTEENIPIVTPAYPQQKLWQESLTQLGMESTCYRPIFDRETKFTIPVESQFATEAYPLAGIFELIKNDSNEIKIQSIEKLERLHMLFNHTYRNFFIELSGLMKWHFDASAKIVNKVDLYRLHRPISGFTAYDLTDLILTTIKRRENK
ncbi:MULTISPECIES: aldolase [Priestia]|uniref:aldolase n=1 Tax=Priestia TaxID=2800373 RepID=UPI00064E487D|nr:MULTISPECIES: aldolase [Priestia]AWD67026.1 aldolase [Priestia megaterium]KML27261.1 aldolase [Priestia aryabhattai]KMN98842.1 aldolase [Priestia aryabhattai]QDZ80702.1 aldolase [Priestia megaterium]